MSNLASIQAYIENFDFKLGTLLSQYVEAYNRQDPLDTEEIRQDIVRLCIQNDADLKYNKKLLGTPEA